MSLQSYQTEAKSSEQLVNRILLGDKTAETEMVYRYQKKLFNSIYSKAHDRELAEDIVQDTWVIALDKIRSSELKNKKKLESYISRIGSYQLIMSYRLSEKNNFYGETDIHEVADEAAGPEQTISRGQLSKAVLALLSSMPIKRDSELLQRYYLIGDSKQELCDEFDLSSSHFDRVIFRARERYKNAWDNRIQDQGRS